MIHRGFEHLLGRRQSVWYKVSYAVPTSPDGLCAGILICEEFIEDGRVIVILGDNISYGNGLGKKFESCGR